MNTLNSISHRAVKYVCMKRENFPFFFYKNKLVTGIISINTWHQNQMPIVLCTHYFACSWLTTLCEFSFFSITLCVDCHLLVPKFGTSMYCNNMILELLVFNF